MKYTPSQIKPIETPIRINVGTLNSGTSLRSISAPTETKNNAAKISLTGVAKTLVTACDLDSAIRTPAKNAPTATDIPN